MVHGTSGWLFLQSRNPAKETLSPTLPRCLPGGKLRDSPILGKSIFGLERPEQKGGLSWWEVRKVSARKQPVFFCPAEMYCLGCSESELPARKQTVYFPPKDW